MSESITDELDNPDVAHWLALLASGKAELSRNEMWDIATVISWQVDRIKRLSAEREDFSRLAMERLIKLNTAEACAEAAEVPLAPYGNIDQLRADMEALIKKLAEADQENASLRVRLTEAHTDLHVRLTTIRSYQADLDKAEAQLARSRKAAIEECAKKVQEVAGRDSVIAAQVLSLLQTDDQREVEK